MFGLPCRGRLVSHKKSFRADQRGAVAFEMLIVFAFLIFILLLPLADMAIAGFRFISARQALRAFGQSIQYTPPSDVANASSWVSSSIAKADPSYPISSINLICGDSNAPCATGNTGSPKSYSYSTTVTLAPMALKSVLCTSGGSDGCTFTLHYSERFQ
jgi:Flp pilus assembly protein TadG